MRGIASGSNLLILANRARVKPDTATPYDLWLVAKDGTDSYQGRLDDTRHAFIHAGYLKASDGKPYTLCPNCGEILPADTLAAA